MSHLIEIGSRWDHSLFLFLFFIVPHQINKMDLLGSILDSMEKPPEVDEKRKEQMKSVLLACVWIFLPNWLWHSFYPRLARRAKTAIGKTARLWEAWDGQISQLLRRAGQSIYEGWTAKVITISAAQSVLSIDRVNKFRIDTYEI